MKTTKLITMKRFISISLVLFAGIVLLASCTKRDYYDDRNDVETGRVVVAPDDYPWYAVVDLGDTYAFIETLSDNEDDWPYNEERLTGVFYDGRDSRVYNEDGGFYVNIRVHGFYNTFAQAESAMDSYYDRYGFAEKKTFLRAPKRIIK